jgi:hypothetical protein
MSKLLASALAVGIVIAGMATAQAMPVAQFESLKSDHTILVSDLPAGHRRAYSVARQRQLDFPYMPSRFNLSGYDAGEGQFCGFGSYVACAYAGTYCWRRCN